ncbi:MAG: hypothetical protein CMK43_08060 [Porticoccaceae bacterium]|nr:hypothetical protein [Porticoccaceae bacterium]
MRRLLISLMFSLLLGAVSVFFLSGNSGYVLVSFDQIVLEMTLWMAVILYGLSIIILYLLWWLTIPLRNPLKFLSWRKNWVNRKSLYLSKKGLQAYCFGHWDLAAENLLKSAKESSNPEINLQLAARASAFGGNLEKAIEILQSTKVEYPSFSMEADYVLADLLNSAGQTREALTIFQQLYSSDRDKNLILPELVKAYVRECDWGAAMGNVKLLRSSKNISKAKIRSIEMEVYVGLLSKVVCQSTSSIEWDEKELRNFWLDVPKDLRSSPELVSSYARALDRVGLGDDAQKMLLRHLNEQWHHDFVESLGRLNHPLSEANRESLEKFLSRFPDDKTLLLALGRVCARSQKFVQACDYLEKAMSLSPNPEVLFELAEAKAAMGDHASSAKLLRRSLAAASGLIQC